MSLETFVIKNEEDAFKALKSIVSPTKEFTFSTVEFDGWPKLTITLRGDEFQQSISPSVMKGFIGLQHGIYKSYASIKYGDPNKRLSTEEKDTLEIQVKIEPGSSILGIDFAKTVTDIMTKVGDKMTPKDVTKLVLILALTYAGTTSTKAFLSERKDVRIAEISAKEKKDTLAQVGDLSKIEKEKMEIISTLASDNAAASNINNQAYDAKIDLLKAMSKADSADFDDVTISKDLGAILTKNARRKSDVVRIDSDYLIKKIDWSNDKEFKVKIYNLTGGYFLDAIVQDDSIDEKVKKAIRIVEWSRTPVHLKVNAKKYDEKTYKNAVILSAEAATTKRADK